MAIPTMYFPSLRVHMLHLSVPVDRPTPTGVVMLVRERSGRGNSRGLTSPSDELGASRLYVPRLVPRPALQNGWSAVPSPWDAESRESLTEDWFLQCGLRPTLAAIGRNHDL